MKLAFAIKSLEVAGGGAERVLVDVANGLAARGHQVCVLTFDRPQAPSFYPLDAAVERIDLDIGLPGVPTPRWRLPTALWRLRRAVRRLRPDLAVGFMHSMYVPLALALSGAPTRVVASEHGGRRHFATRPLQRWLVRAVDRRFVAKTVPAEGQRQSYPPDERERIRVLSNPIALDAFTAPSATPPANVLLCVGRFMEEKDHAVLLDAFAIVAPDFPGWRLRLVGDGVLRAPIEAQVARLGLRDRVDLAGVVRDVAGEYRNAAVVVVPSRYESFGLVTIEALASGRPVVGFDDCLGPLGIVTDGVNAVLVEGDGDRAAHLAAGLRTLMASADLRERLGAAGPEAVQRFDHAAVLPAWERLLLDCVAAP